MTLAKHINSINEAYIYGVNHMLQKDILYNTTLNYNDNYSSRALDIIFHDDYNMFKEKSIVVLDNIEPNDLMRTACNKNIVTTYAHSYIFLVKSDMMYIKNASKRAPKDSDLEFIFNMLKLRFLKMKMLLDINKKTHNMYVNIIYKCILVGNFIQAYKYMKILNYLLFEYPIEIDKLNQHKLERILLSNIFGENNNIASITILCKKLSQECTLLSILSLNDYAVFAIESINNIISNNIQYLLNIADLDYEYLIILLNIINKFNISGIKINHNIVLNIITNLAIGEMPEHRARKILSKCNNASIDSCGLVESLNKILYAPGHIGYNNAREHFSQYAD